MSRLSRRAFLRRGLFGGLLLALGGLGGLSLRKGRPGAPPPGGLRVLSVEEFSVLSAVALRLLPSGDGFPSPNALGVAAAADAALERADPTAQADVKQLLRLFENALVQAVLEGIPRPFTQMSSSQQDAVLEHWRRSRLTLRRAGFNALRALTAAAYYAQPPAWAAVGYPGPPAGFHQPDAPVWRGGPR